jgi:methionyl-tRNA synthetase
MQETPGKVAALFGNFRFRDGVVEAMSLARAANKYFNDSEPWKSRRDNPEQCATTLNICAQLTRSLSILLSPVIPFSAEEIWKMLQLEGTAAQAGWDSAAEMKVEQGREIGRLSILFTKIEDSTIEEQIKKTASGENTEKPATPQAIAPIKAQISIDDFRKVDLRIAEVISCEKVPKSEKLLRIEVQVYRNIINPKT